MLKDEEIQQRYSTKYGGYIRYIEVNDIDEDWNSASKVIKEKTVENIGNVRNKKKKQFNETVDKPQKDEWLPVNTTSVQIQQM